MMDKKRYEAPAAVFRMDAEQAVSYIEGRSGMGKKVGLANTRRLLAYLGNPQECFAAIHVAGTNGKGSTCAYLESSLRAGGFHTGMYTSPYLERYNERICIDGQPIGDELLALSTNIVRTQAERMEQAGEGAPTFFETGTAVAFVAFALCKVDIAVVEVGLGGRLDSTNVLRPLVSAIAHIGLDHVKTLGNSVDEIAFEKGGIIKENTPLVLYPQETIIRNTMAEICRLRHAPFADLGNARIERNAADPQVFSLEFQGYSLRDIRISLLGEHQIYNAALAVAVLWQLQGTPYALPEKAIREGLESASWHGRLEYLHPRLLIDGAHNPQAAQVLAAYLDTLHNRDIILVSAMMRDKDYMQVARILSARIRKAYCTCVDARRGLSGQALCEVYRSFDVDAEEAADPMEAVKKALTETGKDGIVLVAGSLYLSGEVRRRARELKTLYISDMDGTLLTADGRLAETAVSRLNALLDQGLPFSVATARSPYSAVRILAPLHMRLPAILMNGVLLYDVQKKEPVHVFHLEREAYLDAVAAIRKTGTHANVFILDGKELYSCYEQMNTEERLDAERQAEQDGKKYLKVVSLESLAEKDVIFLSVRDTEETVKRIRDILKGNPALTLTVYADVYSDTLWFLEICGRGANKQSAALLLQKMTGSVFLDVFGDNENDLPLFACADRRYAVANAVEKVRKESDEVILSNMEDGVPRKLEELFIPKK